MRSKLFLAVVIAITSLPVFAADAAVGESLYYERCASCHTASFKTSQKVVDPADRAERRKGGPDLALRMKQRSGEELKAWVLEPQNRKVESACNTLVLAREPDLAPDLWAFLQGQLEAPPPKQLERRREALQRNQWRMKTNEDVKRDAAKKGAK